MANQEQQKSEIAEINRIVSEMKAMFDSFLVGMKKISDDPELSRQFVEELEDTFRKQR